MGFFDKLKNGLGKTKISFDEKINNVFSNFRKVDEEVIRRIRRNINNVRYRSGNILTEIISKLREKIKKEKIQMKKV